MPAAFDLRLLVTQLGREFKRRGMEEHVAALREFYRRELRLVEPSTTWTMEAVLEWCARLQIGAFATVYKVVHQSPSRCPFCNLHQQAKKTFLVETSWDGGAKMRCTKCGGGWVQLTK